MSIQFNPLNPNIPPRQNPLSTDEQPYLQAGNPQEQLLKNDERIKELRGADSGGDISNSLYRPILPPRPEPKPKPEPKPFEWPQIQPGESIDEFLDRFFEALKKYNEEFLLPKPDPKPPIDPQPVWPPYPHPKPQPRPEPRPIRPPFTDPRILKDNSTHSDDVGKVGFAAFPRNPDILNFEDRSDPVKRGTVIKRLSGGEVRVFKTTLT